MECGTARGLPSPGATALKPEPPRRYCGRDFSAADLAHLQELLGRQPALNRAQLSRQVCQDLGWRNAGGQLLWFGAGMAAGWRRWALVPVPGISSRVTHRKAWRRARPIALAGRFITGSSLPVI